MNELLMVMVVVLYAVIGSFIVIDVYFDFRLSHRVRKFFRK
jgi:hypothetical protein